MTHYENKLLFWTFTGILKIFMLRVASLLLITASFLACKTPSKIQIIESGQIKDQGQLFIIGGGKLSQELIAQICASTTISEGGYLIILPMSSSEPESASKNIKQLFSVNCFDSDRIVSFDIGYDNLRPGQLDSLASAEMIFLTGGNQNRFMDRISGTKISETLRLAYSSGSTIIGTSAGASLMGDLMITGNQKKSTTRPGEYRSIEAENIEVSQGLGLMDNLIIDQHFIYRMRINRLLSLAIEYPYHRCIGISESTAIHIHGDELQVLGEGQVLRFINKSEHSQKKNGLLGVRDMRLDILLPGDKTSINFN